ncbi:GNAT family N-acetyltransferase [Azospirillum sp. SYSU D00513]|uniref:GNAT family N-acetyltransferase n=1 Tax=Azospirillum sp. SYSU D00513 TaxID=2812561 RepID=UPI001A97C54B|nr:GNAT family N-acetyltransferase [Azospirillum sp. SYSU D00513]
MPANRRLSLRPYEESDLDAVIDIFLRAIREVASKDYGPAQIDAWARADRAIWAERRSSRPTWIATVDGEPAGFTDLEPDGHLDMMYVHPAHQRIGVARALVGQAEAAAHARGLARIYSEVSITARPFFERQGFHVLEEERVTRNGQEFLRYRMEKRLG